MSSGFGEQIINPSGASGGGMHTEISNFRCLGPAATAITAVDTMIPSSRWLELIIDGRFIIQSTIAIDRIIDQDAGIDVYGGAAEWAALELDCATLGLALNLETSYVGVVTYSSWRTNLNTPIPVSRGYARRLIQLLTKMLVIEFIFELGRSTTEPCPESMQISLIYD